MAAGMVCIMALLLMVVEVEVALVAPALKPILVMAQ
jgi:hypothetical protein